MYELQSLLKHKVRVITTDGRLFEGTLQASDRQTNLIMSECLERIIDDDDEDNQEIPLGIYLLRGDTVVCVGEVGDEPDVDWKTVRGAKLKGTKNPL
ncbi:hypothetical protein DICA3_B08592 [Diutina catenulata]